MNRTERQAVNAARNARTVFDSTRNIDDLNRAAAIMGRLVRNASSDKAFRELVAVAQELDVYGTSAYSLERYAD